MSDPLGLDPAHHTCCLHDRHTPRPLKLVVHHAWPRGLGGPDEDENRFPVCDTGHRNIHVVLAALVFGRKLPKASHREIELAYLGYNAWVEAGRPGDPRAAYALHGAQ